MYNVLLSGCSSLEGKIIMLKPDWQFIQAIIAFVQLVYTVIKDMHKDN